ncbi:MAG: PorT family protein [Mucilaginibacter polytrichastri]|nr:PorT family protein [Mucilaginibacter polytrichastri]
MKKIIILSIALLAGARFAEAQVGTGLFKFGIKAGLNTSKIKTDGGAFDEDNIVGYQAGVWARFGSGLYVQPEVYIGSKGGKFAAESNGTTISTNNKVKFTTIDVPVLVGQSFGVSKLNIRYAVGPVYTYYMNTDRTFSQNFSDAYQDFGNYKSSSFGGQAGAGIDIGNLTADIRYEFGLSKINERYGQRPNLWLLSVGYRIF